MKYCKEYGPVTFKFKDKDFIDREVIVTIKNGIIYLNGTKLKLNIFLHFSNNFWHFYDKIDEITELRCKNIKSYIISLFSTRLVKFHGKRVVNNWK